MLELQTERYNGRWKYIRLIETNLKRTTPQMLAIAEAELKSYVH